MKRSLYIIFLSLMLYPAVASARTQPALQVCIIDQSAVADTRSLESIIHGLQGEIDHYFRQYYYTQREIHLSSSRSPGCWPLYVVDGPRRAFGNAVSGWHWVVNGRPYAYVTPTRLLCH